MYLNALFAQLPSVYGLPWWVTDSQAMYDLHIVGNHSGSNSGKASALMVSICLCLCVPHLRRQEPLAVYKDSIIAQ